ncbi:MAG: DegT/DnrJ/EryC1/StrS family aminotransferase [Armatimonadota bacterium]|nr:DegT/DnrJ/EryC1/StrS family aminotransferase [Armatimonadota bacterium]MDR7549011.1 DegT/DnrJ/EryC1/StrS family aminotransferase [Armatimonadota bacterium]
MGSPQIPLSRPDLSEVEVEEVLSVLRTPWLSMGPKVVEFEERFAAFVGVRHAIAVANGTCGLHLALRAVGVRPGVDVITTPFTFIASANVILFEQATPVFCDVDPQTLNLAPEAVEALIRSRYRPQCDRWVNRTTGAPLHVVLPVSVFGHPVAMDGFREVARTFNLRLVHDTCEALGSQYWSAAEDTWVSEAALADAAVFAFYPNKQITTGEGGMVVTQHEAVADYCRMARNQGRRPHAQWLEHEALGFNYRMDELSAALGVAQLRRIGELLARREQVARWYDAALADVEEVERPQAAPWARVAWFVYVVRLRHGIDRDRVMDALERRGIAARPYFPAIHVAPQFAALGYRAGDFPVAEDVSRRTLALPFFGGLTREQVHDVVRGLREAVVVHARG